MLASIYCHDPMFAAAQAGMEAVAALPGWRESLERNPRNREILLQQDPAAFIKKTMVWGASFIPAGGESVPGLSSEALANLKMPVMVFRSGEADVHHPRETSEAVHWAPGSKLVEPPWGDREWIDRTIAQGRGEGLFARWPLLAPQLPEYAKAQWRPPADGRGSGHSREHSRLRREPCRCMPCRTFTNPLMPTPGSVEMAYVLGQTIAPDIARRGLALCWEQCGSRWEF